jgi:hypothetical protein
MELRIEPSGLLRCIYDETIDLSSLGIVSIRRASQVEPDAEGRWWADLTPVNGPVVGPFSARSAALLAEVRWLETNWL